ncbi:peptidoglycan-binding domain-containing protein [Luteibacter sp.]|nr:peptidoglycan-binding domain-containing protein [Luteibacter sp.]MDQ8048675.1 peptidoglycan-binding domain-containing protein [Luteibacter sp.]
MTGPNTRDRESTAGAMYFIVGRGTEGGAASYRLSVAGVSDRNWGDPDHVVDNSGYSIGTIQVDLGQRGTWALGAIDSHIEPGQTSYVDGVVNESAAYARSHELSFPQDTSKMRADLLTHGNGKDGRTTISFIDADARASVNAWASSEDGKKWGHANVDYPQVKNATNSAMDMLDHTRNNIPDDRRLETIAILTKTANQYPSQLGRFRTTLDNGGTYQDVMDTAQAIKAKHGSYAGPEAADVAERYKAAFSDPEKAASLERAQSKVATAGFDPSTQATDHDISSALRALGQSGRGPAAHQSGALRTGSHGEHVSELQSNLISLGVTDSQDRPLNADGNFGRSTQAAVEKFQAAHGMTADGVVGNRTNEVIQREVEAMRQSARMSLSDERHPGVSLYNQALTGVRGVDEQMGRVSDQASCQLAGSLAVAACGAGFSRVDHVVMSDDGARAYAVQGALNSPFKQYTDVDVSRAIATPLEQSGNDFVQAAQRNEQQQTIVQQPLQAVSQEAGASHPAMQR